MKTKIEKSEKTICFSNEKFLERLKQYINFDTSGKPAVKIGDTEQYWRLPSSPIVKKHVVSLCKFKSVLIYTWIAKPFFLPLQIFDKP